MDNYQAKAYAVLAMIELGYSLEDVQKVKNRMSLMMDLYSEKEAEEKVVEVIKKVSED